MSNDSINTASNEVNLDKYLAAVWRAKWLIFLIALAAAAVAYYFARQQPLVYKANAIIEVGRVWKEPLEDLYITEQTTNSSGFLHELANKIGVKAKALNHQVQAEALTAGPRRSRYPTLLQITATTESEEEAVRLAGAVADAVIARHDKLFDDALALHKAREQRLEEQLKDLKTQAAASRELLFKIEDELDSTRYNNTSPTATRKTTLTQPIVASAVAIPSPWRSVVAAALIAAIAVIALAVLKAAFTSLPAKQND